jgi:crossover junction endodeoxyribonuclease RusA
VHRSKEADAYREEVGWVCKAAGILKPLEGRIWLDLALYPERPQDWARRTRQDPQTWDDTVRCIDLGNAEKVLSDALEGIVFLNDAQIWRQTKERREPDDGGARVEVGIHRLAPRSLRQQELVA